MKTILILIISIISLNLYSQREYGLIGYQLKDLSYIFGKAHFGYIAKPIYEKKGSELDELVNTKPNGGTYSSIYSNWFCETFYHSQIDANYHLIIGVSNNKYTIFIFKGEMVLIGVIKFSFTGGGYTKQSMDHYYKSNDFMLMKGYYTNIINRNLRIKLGESDLIPNYIKMFHTKYTDDKIMDMVALEYNPISLIERKSNSFTELYNVVK